MKMQYSMLLHNSSKIVVFHPSQLPADSSHYPVKSKNDMFFGFFLTINSTYGHLFLNSPEVF